MLDLNKGMVYFDRAKATAGTYSNFIKVSTVSGLSEYHEIKFSIKEPAAIEEPAVIKIRTRPAAITIN